MSGVLKVCIYLGFQFVVAEIAKENRSKTFPKEFKFGVATSSYQIEGGWNEDGKGWSVWDHKLHVQPETTPDGSNGDIAADSYHMHKRDVQMLKELGVQNYRFSISWPRIMPIGTHYVNPKGIAYYNELIDELLANDITPFVTMYHWDLPLYLHQLGGWLNGDIAEWFGEYARVLYTNFGDRVKHWMTINEPHFHCNSSDQHYINSPLKNYTGIGYYECGRNILLAHAKAYHIYDDEFRQSQGGTIGFVISMEWAIPSVQSDDMDQILRDYRAFRNDYYIHPLMTESGNYPQIMIDRVAAASARQGFSSSRLRPFSEEQIQNLKGTVDFLGLNSYSSFMVYRNESLRGKYEVPSYFDDMDVGFYKDPTWPFHGRVYEYPPGIYKILLYIKEKYNNPVIYISENGCSSLSLGLNDDGRVGYLKNYISAVADAVSAGVNVKGYFLWTLMDSFEWFEGYKINFGIYELDRKHPNRTCTARKSALVYKQIIANRVVDYSYNPDPYTVQP